MIAFLIPCGEHCSSLQHLDPSQRGQPRPGTQLAALHWRVYRASQKQMLHSDTWTAADSPTNSNRALMSSGSLKNDCAQRDPNWRSQASALHNWVSLKLHRAALKGSYNFGDLRVRCQWAPARGWTRPLLLPGSAGQPRLCFVRVFPGKRLLADAEFLQFLSHPQLWAEDAAIYQEFLPNRGTKGPCTGCGNFPHVDEPPTVKDCRPNPSVLTQTKVHIDFPQISLQTPIQVNGVLPGRRLGVWPNGCRCNWASAERNLPQHQAPALCPGSPTAPNTVQPPTLVPALPSMGTATVPLSCLWEDIARKEGTSRK